ncbi:MAG: hypothetical protein PVI21_04270 [Candidatus Woesebacteria bacterium]|jgi:hypothetical protein
MIGRFGLTKKIFLAAFVVFAVGFYVGITTNKAEAFPFIDGRWRGYFERDLDYYGPGVIAGGLNASHSSSYNIDNFVSDIGKCLYNAPPYETARNAPGGAFIVLSMLGYKQGNPAWSDSAWGGIALARAEFGRWETLVRSYASNGYVNFNAYVSYTINTYHQGSPGPFDVAYYTVGTSYTWAIRFAGPNGADYIIKHDCGNPLGDMDALPEVSNYDITGYSTVSNAAPKPGQTITFNHYIRNNGPTSTGTRVIWWAAWEWPSWSNGVGNAYGTMASGQQALVHTENYTVPVGTAPGTQICRIVGWDPDDSWGGRDGRGTPVCATVAWDYELTPTVSSSASSAQPGDTITFTYSISNSGPTVSQNTNCKVVGNVRSSGYTPLPLQDVDRTSDGDYSPPSTICPTTVNASSAVTVATETIVIGDETPGTRLCRSLVIDPRDENGGVRSSAESCVVIAKTPYVHMMGNDVWAGGGFASVNPACNTSSKIQTVAHTLGDGSIAGSASEYAAFALGKITNFGSSNKALINPSGVAGKALTFANIDSSNLGNFGAPQHCITDYVAKYDKDVNDGGVPSAIDVGAMSDGTQLNITGPRSFSGEIGIGSRQVYLVEGDVTITGDIKYPSKYNGISEIPSLVIIATGNITVNRDVTQIDGLFVSRGQFFTCDVPVATTLSVSGPCEKQLTVNGAVITGELQLLRTYGADGENDTDRKRPAEVFKFNSEMYLRSALTGDNPNYLQTTQQIDLPPRY